MPDFRLKQAPVTGEIWVTPGIRTYEGRDWPLDTEGNPIRYSIAGPPTVSGTGDAMKVTYRVRVSIFDADLLAQNILGWSTNDLANVGYINRRLPLKDFDRRGMLAESFTFEYQNPSGYNPLTEDIDSGIFSDVTGRINDINPSDQGIALYRYALFTITFGYPVYDVFSNATIQAAPYQSERFRYTFTTEQMSSEYVQLERAVIFWIDSAAPAYIANGNAPVQVTTGAGFVRNINEVVCTWYRVPYDAIVKQLPLWRYYLGSVNDAAFTLPLAQGIQEYYVGTMLFKPWVLRPRQTPTGQLEYDVELHWAVRENYPAPSVDGGAGPGGWNYFLDQSDGKYYQCGWEDPDEFSGYRPVYPLQNHDDIFAILS